MSTRPRVANNIKSKVDAIDAFPAETEQPITAEVSIIATVFQIAISGPADERTLKLIGQRMRDDIAALPGVSQVVLQFSRPYEISVEVSEQTLRRHGLTLATIGEAIERSSIDIPGGSIKTEGGEILLRTKGQAYRGEEFEDIVVLTRADGTSVNVGEIANVVDGFEESDLQARFDGNPAVFLKVSRVGEEDIIQIADRVKAYLEQARKEVPEGIALTIWQDESQDLVDRLDALTRNARSGLLLVLLVLTLFLRFRLALWVAAGIPVALLGTVAIFPLAGVSISTMTVMAFILVLGILVDDAIVVGERVYAHEAEWQPTPGVQQEWHAGGLTTCVFRRLDDHGDLHSDTQYSRSDGRLLQAAGLYRHDCPGLQSYRIAIDPSLHTSHTARRKKRGQKPLDDSLAGAAGTHFGFTGKC